MAPYIGVLVPSLFVVNSKGATLQGGKLVLTGISLNAIVFADRPVRAAGHDLTSRIVEDWGSGTAPRIVPTPQSPYFKERATGCAMRWSS
jgi:hypothetical protein